MPATKIAPISGVAHLTPKFRHMAETLHGPGFARDLLEMAEDAIAVDAFARLLDRALIHAQAKDGRIDLREMAMFCIKEIKANQL